MCFTPEIGEMEFNLTSIFFLKLGWVETTRWFSEFLHKFSRDIFFTVVLGGKGALRILRFQDSTSTLSETNIAPENWGLEYDFPFGKASL